MLIKRGPVVYLQLSVLIHRCRTAQHIGDSGSQDLDSGLSWPLFLFQKTLDNINCFQGEQENIRHFAFSCSHRLITSSYYNRFTPPTQQTTWLLIPAHPAPLQHVCTFRRNPIEMKMQFRSSKVPFCYEGITNHGSVTALWPHVLDCCLGWDILR